MLVDLVTSLLGWEALKSPTGTPKLPVAIAAATGAWQQQAAESAQG